MWASRRRIASCIVDTLAALEYRQCVVRIIWNTSVNYVRKNALFSSYMVYRHVVDTLLLKLNLHRWGWHFLHPSRPALGLTQCVPEVFPIGKAAREWRWPTPIQRRVQKRVQLYLYHRTPSPEPSWLVLGLTLLYRVLTVWDLKSSAFSTRSPDDSAQLMALYNARFFMSFTNKRMSHVFSPQSLFCTPVVTTGSLRTYFL